MRYMYYCADCDFIASDDGEYSAAICPKCGKPLYATYLPRNEWKSKKDDEKKALVEKWKAEISKNDSKTQYTVSQTGTLYEYDVVTILNEDHGRIDTEKMRTVISQKSQQGWRLHTVYSNELGKNAISLLGLGVNTTACEDVLIFERLVKVDDHD